MIFLKLKKVPHSATAAAISHPENGQLRFFARSAHCRAAVDDEPLLLMAKDNQTGQDHPTAAGSAGQLYQD